MLVPLFLCGAALEILEHDLEDFLFLFIFPCFLALSSFLICVLKVLLAQESWVQAMSAYIPGNHRELADLSSTTNNSGCVAGRSSRPTFFFSSGGAKVNSVAEDNAVYGGELVSGWVETPEIHRSFTPFFLGACHKEIKKMAALVRSGKHCAEAFPGLYTHVGLLRVVLCGVLGILLLGCWSWCCGLGQGCVGIC